MNIGLVLSGGMAKGAYQIGALKALNNFVPLEEIKYISAASVGVLNGYAYATNNIENADTLRREITPLLSIRDGYKKMIITRLNHEGYIENGVEIVDISDWLLKKL